MLKRLLKPAIFVLSLLPFSWCLYQMILFSQGQPHSLGADPGKVIVDYNGQWALRFLILTLTITPIRLLFSFPAVVRVRRMLGLFTFFYATLHLISYSVFLLELQFSDILLDLAKRPYIAVGMAAFTMLALLAVTSNRWMISRLGVWWKRLHKLIYLISALVVVHLTWLTKSEYMEAFLYGLAIAVLLAFRAARLGWIHHRMPVAGR